MLYEACPAPYIGGLMQCGLIYRPRGFVQCKGPVRTQHREESGEL